MPVTSNPASAKAIASGRPAYPRPTIPILAWRVAMRSSKAVAEAVAEVGGVMSSNVESRGGQTVNWTNCGGYPGHNRPTIVVMREIRHVLSVVGARPNFMKTAPVIAALARRSDPVRHTLVHTGQHYDDAMSKIFLEQLGVGAPDYMLDVGSGSHAAQTARVMERIEPVLAAERPDIVLVPGDINSTVAAALVAAKLDIPVGHIEAGLRSFDRTMPEEVNRILTDQLSNLLFIHSPEARDNLVREGVDDARIHAVGNTMIDTLVAMRPRIEELDAPAAHGLPRDEYIVVTLHRPALVDGPLLAQAVAALDRIAEQRSEERRVGKERR